MKTYAFREGLTNFQAEKVHNNICAKNEKTAVAGKKGNVISRTRSEGNSLSLDNSKNVTGVLILPCST